MNAIQSILQYYPSRWALGGATFCGLAAAEMGIRVVGNLFQMRDARGQRELSENLAGACFYGLCAANLLPGTAVFGGVVCLLQGLLRGNSDNPYYLSRAIFTVADLTWTTLSTIADWTIVPLWNYVLFPVLEKIANVARAILKLIPLPENSTWYVVALLVVGIAAYKGIPALYNTASFPSRS